MFKIYFYCFLLIASKVVPNSFNIIPIAVVFVFTALFVLSAHPLICHRASIICGSDIEDPEPWDPGAPWPAGASTETFTLLSKSCNCFIL